MKPVVTEGRRSRFSPERYVEGILRRDRAMLARAITVIESELPSDAGLAAEILKAILPHSGNSVRVGITGVPGAGKSTLIDRLGIHLIRDRREKVAVLTVDPSSPISKGSILGDKTRMANLSAETDAFIRPSPSGGRLGGVAHATREIILLCEAAGYQNIVVETVGVGQSETSVRSMTDFYLLLMIPGAGDQLQGIKRGIFELVDAIAVNKADSGNEGAAETASGDYAAALNLFPPFPDSYWRPKVITTSCLTGRGIGELWNLVRQHHAQSQRDGTYLARRQRQRSEWMHELVTQGLLRAVRMHPQLATTVKNFEAEVSAGRMIPTHAAQEILLTLNACLPVTIP